MLKVKTDFWWNFKQSYKTCFKNVNKEDTFYQNEILKTKHFYLDFQVKLVELVKDDAGDEEVNDERLLP